MTKTREQRAEEYCAPFSNGETECKYYVRIFLAGAQSEAELWAEKVRICQEALEFYAEVEARNLDPVDVAREALAKLKE